MQILPVAIEQDHPRFANTVMSLVAVCIGALAFIWPALLNGYPLVFSDTHVFIAQPAPGFFNWDKPFIYGPWMLLLHGWRSLWWVAAAQALLLSQLLWLTAACVARRALHRHLLTCFALGLVSTAPWFASFLMPDIFAGLAVLALFVLGFDRAISTWLKRWVVIVASLAIAVHLSHLIIAATCLCVVLLFRPRRFLLALVPLLIALIALVGTSYLAFGKFSVSPHGSVFMLARLSADGHTQPILDKYCASRTWHLCEWSERLPTDSDRFLWDGTGVVWSHPDGPIGLAPEASEIVRAVVTERPLQVLVSSVKNTVNQMSMIKLGDTLHSDYLDLTVEKVLREYFPDAEVQRFQSSLQAHNELLTKGLFGQFERYNLVMQGVVCLSLALSLYLLLTQPKFAGPLVVMLCVGFVANALATGALSKPHDRYQARVSWLLLLPPLMLIGRRPRK